MKSLGAVVLGIAAAVMVAVTPQAGFAQSLVLDPMSASLPGIPATSTDILRPATAIPSLPPPVVGWTAAQLGLLPGDVIDAITYGDDGPPPGSTIYFSVTRGSVGAPGPFPPDVASEVGAVPAGTQADASGDIFTALDPTCGVFPPFNTQALDGNGMALVPFTCYGGFGLGLTELLAAPGPPLNDDLSAFDWGAPGVAALTGIGFSLAAGSPTLTAGTNPLLPAGATPGDLLVVTGPGTPFPFLFIFSPAAALGLVGGPPGCAPPVCDDVDALSVSFPAGGTLTFSIAPGSPSIGLCGYSTADVLGGVVGPIPACAPPFLPAGAIGLAAGADLNALEIEANACPVAPIPDPDGDGFGACDNCPAPGGFNPGQEDTDGDLIGDACDLCTDIDADGFGNPGFPANACPTDLCPFTPGPNGDGDADGVGDICDNCPLNANANQADADFDGVGNVCDPCPNMFGAAPLGMTMKKVLLLYKSTGPDGFPGPGDDIPKVIKATFTPTGTFDPDSADDVHLTLRDGGTGAIMFAASLTSASTLWSQPNPAKLKWKYLDTATPTAVGVKRALLKESPAGSGSFFLIVVGKDAGISGPLVGPGITATVEIEPGSVGECFTATNLTCTSTSASDKCKP